jgi:hypothetical protein
MKTWKKWLISAAATVAAALDLTEQHGFNPYGITGLLFQRIFNALVIFLDSLQYDNAVILMIFLLIFGFLHLPCFKNVKYDWFTGLAAFVIAFLRAGSELFLGGSDLTCLLIPIVFLKFAVKVLGYTLLFEHVLLAFGAALPKLTAEHREEISFRKSALVIGLGLLPNLIIRYPGASCWDAWYQLYMVRTGEYSAHHPMLYTLLLGKTVLFFEKLGSANLGLFVVVSIQYVALVLVFAYGITLMNRMNISNKWKWITMALCIFNPYIAAYIGLANYDFPYNVCMLLVLFMVLDYWIDAKAFVTSKKKLILLAVGVFGAWNLRKNGPYMLVPTLLVLMIALAVRKELVGRRFVNRFVLVAVASCIVAAGADSLMVKATNASPDDIGSAFSIPLQQMARICISYDSVISSEDKETINRFLEYDVMITSYDPRISDPIKSCVREDSTKEEMIAFFKVWLKLACKYPLTALSATYAQNYYFFTPETTSPSVYQDTQVGYELGLAVSNKDWISRSNISFEKPEVLNDWKRLSTGIYVFLMTCPVIGAPANLAIQTYIFLFLLWAVLHKREWRKLTYFIPMCLVILIAVAAPVIQGHLRYVFVLFYALPFTVAVAAWKQDNEPAACSSEPKQVAAEDTDNQKG